MEVLPLSRQKIDINLVKGQETPWIQGWYSPEYNVFGPNTTSIFSTAIDGSTTFVWLLFPSERKMPQVEAKIISEIEDEVQIEVKSKNEIWQLTVPFINSEKAKLTKR